jgi:putative ABC transport system permease protein
MESFLSDLRYALRNLARRPGFTAVSVLVLALGLGATVTMYSTLNAVVLQPLPFKEPGRLVWIWNITPEGLTNSLSAEDYFDYRDQTTSLESLAARNVFRPGRIVTGGSEPERVTTITVSENLFSTLGIAPLLGRSFTADEAVVGAPAVVMLSHGFWQRRHGGDPGVVGQSIMIEGAPYQVVGIMPEGFDFPGEVELWFPMRRGGPAETGRGNNNFLFIGRLAEGASLARADAEFKAMAARLVETYPDVKKGWNVRVVPLALVLVGPTAGPLLMLLGAVLLLLLIACANISSLFLARVTARQGEFAVRLALGAPRKTLVRQLLTESLVISMAGAVLGVGVSLLGMQVLRSSSAIQLPRIQDLGLDPTVLLFALVITLITALLVGVLPALRSADTGLLGLMTGSGRTTAGERVPGWSSPRWPSP